MIAKLEQPKHGRRNRFSTVFSYTTRLLTVLEGLAPVQLTQLSTLDLAAFLGDYATANTAKAYKAVVHSFYLFVSASKTKAGKRALPLYLLLSRRELQLVTAFVAAAQRERGADAFLVVAPDGSHIRPEVLSRRISKLLRAGGVYGETAHGLRHAFASELLAAWWLRMTEAWPSPKDLQTNGWTRSALLSFGRPGIEGRAVEHADDLRRLLGHADIAVTFERYIHILDLVAADAIRLAESHSALHRMTRSQAAQLNGVTDRAARQRFKVTERGEPASSNRKASITLSQVENWLDVRLVRIARRASNRSHSR